MNKAIKALSLQTVTSIAPIALESYRHSNNSPVAGVNVVLLVLVILLIYASHETNHKSRAIMKIFGSGQGLSRAGYEPLTLIGRQP